MRGIFYIFLAAVILLCAPTIWGQSDIEIQKGKDIGQFLTSDNRIDLQAIRSSGYQGSLNLDGFSVGIDPSTGEPVVRMAKDGSKADPDDVYWEGGFGLTGADNYVRALTVYDNTLIVGGGFTSVGGLTANYIAAWDGTAWSALATGMNEQVLALTVYDNKLIAGGNFTEAGGTTVNYVAAWDGSAWSALGTGTGSNVHSLVEFGSDLIVGGSFTTAGGVGANRVAAWDGSSWSALGTGTDNIVSALIVFEGNLIAGGWFTSAGGNTANYIASWNGSSWSALGDGMNWGIEDFAIFDGELFAGGWFSMAGGVEADNIASWDGSAWLSFGSDVNGVVYAFAVFNNELIVAGDFTGAGGESCNFIASFNGSSWSSLNNGMSASVRALTVFGGDLIAGGNFTAADDSPVNYIASWDNSSWSAISSGLGMDGLVFALTVYDGKLIAGGDFMTAGETTVNSIAAWDGVSWSSLGDGINGVVYALTVYDNGLIAGGEFTSAGGVSTHNIASWDGSEWLPMTYGINDGAVLALTVYDNKLIAGGEFTSAGGVSANRIASWDGEWWALGLGISGGSSMVWALTVYDDKLIAGGEFTSAGGVSANCIAAWDGSAWSALGSGMDYSDVHDLTVYDNELIAGATGSNYIAAWDGSVWSALGSGVTSGVSALTVYDNKLIAGGYFATAGGVSANYIAAWDGSSWSALGSGMNGYVYALAVHDNKLIVGGDFTTAGEKASSYIAVWNKPLPYNQVTSLDDDGTGTLRAAITGANANVGADTITFAVSGTIDLLTPLPEITDDSTVILGESAPGGNHSIILNGLMIPGHMPILSPIGSKYVVKENLLQFSLHATDADGTIPEISATWLASGMHFDDYMNGTGQFSWTPDYTQAGVYMVNFRASDGVLVDSEMVLITVYESGKSDGQPIIIDSSITASTGGNKSDSFRQDLSSGLVLQSSYNVISGIVISGFPGNGIDLTGAAKCNTISNNLIYNNGFLGIDLNDDGVTINDAGDGDTGPNDYINYPQIDSLFMNADSSFRVYGTAADSGIIEFFVAHPEGDISKPADPSGYGEAWEYIGSDIADINGDFEYEISNTVAYFSLITATATDTLGNTSEFAPNFNLTPSPLIIVGYSPINLHIIDPAGDSIGKLSDDTYFNTIGLNATYEDIVHDSITIQYPLEGEYIIIVYPQGDPPPGALYSVGIRIDGSMQAIIVENANAPASGTADTLGYLVEEEYHYANGDASGDETVNLIDILYLIAYLYNSPPGPAPYPLGAGDANCDLTINLIDILYLIANKYNNPPGPAPCEL